MKISVRTGPDGERWREVEAEMVGRYLAVLEEWSSWPLGYAGLKTAYWVVIHVPSGFQISSRRWGRWRTRRAALEFAADIVHVDYACTEREMLIERCRNAVATALRKRGMRM